MGKEGFIKGHGDNGHHDGRRSAVRRIQSAMDQIKAWRQERTIANESGHVLPFAGQPETVKAIFGDYGETGTEIDLYTHPDWEVRECLDTRVFNHSVSRQWFEDSNPREDAWTPRASRIDPSS